MASTRAARVEGLLGMLDSCGNYLDQRGRKTELGKKEHSGKLFHWHGLRPDPVPRKKSFATFLRKNSI